MFSKDPNGPKIKSYDLSRFYFVVMGLRICSKVILALG